MGTQFCKQKKNCKPSPKFHETLEALEVLEVIRIHKNSNKTKIFPEYFRKKETKQL